MVEDSHVHCRPKFAAARATAPRSLAEKTRFAFHLLKNFMLAQAAGM
jgi:hypothetical protein